VLVVEQSPLSRQPSGLARLLEHDEKVVAHFDVRSCSAADLRSEVAERLLGAARDVVVHLDGETPGRMLRLVRDLLDDPRSDRDRVIAVATGSAAPDDLLDRLQTTGLARQQVIIEGDQTASLRRLILQLCTRRSAELPS
jgi:hypothetical protein